METSSDFGKHGVLGSDCNFFIFEGPLCKMAETAVPVSSSVSVFVSVLVRFFLTNNTGMFIKKKFEST